MSSPTDRLPSARPAVNGLPAYRPGKGAAQAEAEHGITNAIKLASNENPDPPLDEILAAVAAAAAGANRYADHRATALRERIGGWLGVDPSSVTVGAGSVGLLQQLFLTFVDPGDEVLYPWRSFEVYPVYTRLMGGTEVTTPLRADHAFDLASGWHQYRNDPAVSTTVWYRSDGSLCIAISKILSISPLICDAAMPRLFVRELGSGGSDSQTMVLASMADLADRSNGKRPATSL